MNNRRVPCRRRMSVELPKEWTAMRKPLLLIGAALLVAACQSAVQPVPIDQPEPLEVPQSQPLPVEQPEPLPVPGFPTPDGNADQPPTVTGPCANPYLPVVEGASWTYDFTTSSGTVPLTQTISDVGSDGFLMMTDNPDISFAITWKCSQQGLYWLQSTGGMFAGVFQSAAGTGTVETLSYAGVSIPTNVHVGDSWSTDEEITANAFGVNETFTIHTDYRAVGMETVTVPAGTFDALRVDMEASNDSQTLPVTIQGSTWFAADIGQVKNAGVANGNITSDEELTSYSIP